MAKWKPKTIFGKIVKGAVIGGGSILGLSVGVGAVKGVVKGTGALAGAMGATSGLWDTGRKLKDSAVNLITGTTKAERKQLNTVKAKTRAEADKIQQVQRLINAGATPEDARAMVGLTNTELPAIEGETLTPTMAGGLGLPSWALPVAAGLALLFFFMNKKR
jgi:hypothetical protein